MSLLLSCELLSLIYWLAASYGIEEIFWAQYVYEGFLSRHSNQALSRIALLLR